MAPRVESLEGNVDHFLVDLQSPDPFDVALFEELAKGVDYRTTIDTSMLKYIVMNGKMWIFSERQIHSSFYEKLKRRAESGELQSAGAITIAYYSPDLQNRVVSRRKIEGRSSSLVLELSSMASDKYKFTEIAGKLGEYFRIE